MALCSAGLPHLAVKAGQPLFRQAPAEVVPHPAANALRPFVKNVSRDVPVRAGVGEGDYIVHPSVGDNIRVLLYYLDQPAREHHRFARPSLNLCQHSIVTSRASQTLRGSSRLSTWKRGEVVLAEGLHQGGRLVAGGAVERLKYRLAGKVADRVVRRAHRLGYPSGRGWPAEKAASVFADRRAVDDDGLDTPLPYLLRDAQRFAHRVCRAAHGDVCLLYTSDAADDLLCVDLGGRRIIKKKKKKKEQQKINTK